MKKQLFSLFVFLIFYTGLNSCSGQKGEFLLEPSEFSKKIMGTPSAVVLDVRTAEEVREGFIAGAMNIDFNDQNFEKRVSELDKSKTYFVYCLAGGRSGSAASWMKGQGFQNVYDLKGGMLAWRKEGMPESNLGDPPKMDEIREDAYRQMISSGIVVVDFYAPWCGPCKKMEPMWKEIEKEYAGKIKIIRINVDKNKQLTILEKATAIPVIKVYKSGKETFRHEGFIEKSALTENLN